MIGIRVWEGQAFIFTLNVIALWRYALRSDQPSILNSAWDAVVHNAPVLIPILTLSPAMTIVPRPVASGLRVRSPAVRMLADSCSSSWAGQSTDISSSWACSHPKQSTGTPGVVGWSEGV